MKALNLGYSVLQDVICYGIVYNLYSGILFFIEKRKGPLYVDVSF